MTQEELTNAFKYIVKKCDMLINNDDYEADAYTQDTVEDIAELCNHILDEDYGKLVEVKEVDLDFQRFAKEMDAIFALPSSETKNTEEEPLNWEYAIAKHFYELGLKAQKGE